MARDEEDQRFSQIGHLFRQREVSTGRNFFFAAVMIQNLPRNPDCPAFRCRGCPNEPPGIGR